MYMRPTPMTQNYKTLGRQYRRLRQVKYVHYNLQGNHKKYSRDIDKKPRQ